MNAVEIRAQRPSDLKDISELILAAFRDDPHSDHREQELVYRLVHSPACIPGLSLVACTGSTLAGYILLSRVHIQTKTSALPFLSLAPVCVRPEFQHQGIGTALIEAAHQRARQLNEPGVVLIGHDSYYPRFGYQPAAAHGITFPFEVSARFCFVKIFEGKTAAPGNVVYPPQFFG